jgi:hypothetical protein
MRGRPWSKDEENQLQQLVRDGKGFDEISSIKGKSRLSVKGKLFNSGLNCVEVATRVQRAVGTTIATTTSPTKGNAGSFGISDRCNCCAKFSCSSIFSSSRFFP